MDENLVNELTKHINETKNDFNYQQQGLVFLATVERSTSKKIEILKNDIITPKSPQRVNPFFMPFTGLAKIYDGIKSVKI